MKNVNISNKLLISASQSRRKYGDYLEEEKAKKLQSTKNKKRKLEMDEVDELKAKKRRLDEVKLSLERQANSVYDEIENTSSVKKVKDLVAKGNAMRKDAIAKDQEASEIDNKIKELLLKIANE